MYTYYFERLDVWQNARKLTKKIYILTRDFPVEEKYGLTDQIRRATFSISLNISEGMARRTSKDKGHFINNAYSSSWEVINCLILANDLEYADDDSYIALRNDLEKITNQLNALYNKITKK